METILFQQSPDYETLPSSSSLALYFLTSISCNFKEFSSSLLLVIINDTPVHEKSEFARHMLG